MKGTTGRLRLGTEALASLEIPLPPLVEQRRIIAKLKALSAQLDAGVNTLKVELTRAEHLQQSILKYAFSGKLVPQDPNDEPASVLLEKIRKKTTSATEAKKEDSKGQNSIFGKAIVLTFRLKCLFLKIRALPLHLMRTCVKIAVHK